MLLIAGLLGAVALAGLVASAVIHQNRRHTSDGETPSPSQHDEQPGPSPGEPPRESAEKREQPFKNTLVPQRLGKPSSAPPAAMRALPPAVRAIEFRTPSARPEYIQNSSGAPFSIEAPFEKLRAIFPHDNRIAQDAVVVWQSNDGVAGLGEQLTVDCYSGQTGTRIKRFGFEGDGKHPRCDVSPDGKHFAAATTSGSITVWNLADESKILHGFDPYADKSEHKQAGLAALYLTGDPGRLVTISSAGAVHLFQIADRKLLSEFLPPHASPGRIIAGRNVAADEARSSVVLAVGGIIYHVATTAPLSVVWQLRLEGDVERSFGIAAVGVPGRIAYAFETAGPKSERGVLFCMPKEQPVFYRWPEEADEPASIHWSGTNMAIVGSSRGAVWVESADKTFLPVALAEVAGSQSIHHATESCHWYVMPHPEDKTRSLLLALGLPPQDFLDFRNAARAREPLYTVRLDEKGLWK